MSRRVASPRPSAVLPGKDANEHERRLFQRRQAVALLEGVAHASHQATTGRPVVAKPAQYPLYPLLETDNVDHTAISTSYDGASTSRKIWVGPTPVGSDGVHLATISAQRFANTAAISSSPARMARIISDRTDQ